MLSTLNLRLAPAKLAVLFAALLVLPFVAFTATANAAYSNCGSGNFCVWEGFGGGGARYSYGGNWHDTCINLIPSWNDRVSSAYNHLSNGVRVQLFNGDNCDDYGSVWIYPGHTLNLLGDPFQNDEVTSIKFD